MNFINGLQSATRNCVFFRFHLLASWRKCNTLAVISPDCHQVQINHTINKYQGLGVNQCDRLTFLPENFYFSKTVSSKRPGCLLNTSCKEIGMVTPKCTVWNDSFSRQLLLKEVTGVPALSQLHPLNCLHERDIRSFHTSPRFQATPVPLLLIILKPVQKLFAIIVGR